MKSNWKEEYLEKLIEDLNCQVDELEKKTDALEKENELLRKKDKINQETIRSVRKIEFEYYQKLEELKTLKEKYKKLISDVRDTKKEYSLKFNEAVKEIKNRK